MRNTRYVDPFTFQRAKYWSRFSREIINSDSPIPNLPTRIPYSETNELGCKTNERIHHFVSPTFHRSDERAKTTGTNSHFLTHQLQFLLRFRRSRVIMHQTTNRSKLPYTVTLRLT